MEKKLIVFGLGSVFAIHPAFHVPFESGNVRIELHFEAVVNDKEVLFETPFFTKNDLPIECHCGKRALKIVAKEGKVSGFCIEHTPQEQRIAFIDKQNKDSYEKISLESIAHHETNKCVNLKTAKDDDKSSELKENTVSNKDTKKK